MEQLNSQIYAKYNDLKKRKALIDEDWNLRRDADICEFQSAVEVVEELKKENDRLREEVDSLQEQTENYQDLMLEECRKTKQLSDEVERLQNLLSEMGTNKDAAVLRTPQTSARVTGSNTKGSMGKSTPESVTRYHEVLDKEPNSVPKDNPQTKVLVPDCCRGSITCSGDVQGICVFQNLFELLLGMQFSVDSQTEGPCLSAVHQMSGYTFTLTWLRREDGEGEFRYRVSSLGTLERVALEWMKEDIIFSRSMWPVFFERMSRAIGCR